MAWPVLVVLLTFGWHLYCCMPLVGTTRGEFTITSINPVTNVIVLTARQADDLTRVGYALGAGLGEKAFRDAARARFDVWGMAFGYSIIIESS